VPNQHGKVFIVTGGSSGQGFELSRILYGASSTVYMLTLERARRCGSSRIQRHYNDTDETGSNRSPSRTRGRLEFIPMDLLDFESVKKAAHEFLTREGSNGRLDILFNNASIVARKSAPLSAQQHEHHVRINSLGPYLLTRLLEPILSQTARNAASGSVRVVRPASVKVEMNSPNGGIRREF
ncbi:hypothetical protein EV127DRAFT_337700, partial [Xylaria flabelliformis]